MVQEQAQILAKKSRAVRAPSDVSARIDREANSVVARNVRKLIKDGKYAQVTELLQQSTSLSIMPVVTALRSFMKEKRSDELNEFMRLIRSKQILPPESVFNDIVCYFANGARGRTPSKRGDPAAAAAATTAASKKKASVEAERAYFFFADLKTAYLPSSATYEAIWNIVPVTRQKNRTVVLAEHHDALWREMTTNGVSPSERVCETVLRSLRPELSPTTISSMLSSIEAVFRASFGIDPQTTSASVSSLSQDILGSRHSKNKISGPLAKLWIKTILALEGEEKAFRLASSVLYEVAENGSLPRAASSNFHASNATFALARAYEPKLAAKLDLTAQAPRAIPTEFCPYEPLIDALSEQGKSYAIVHAWNMMSPIARLGAAPSTVAAVVAASASPESLTEVFAVLSASERASLKKMIAELKVEDPKNVINNALKTE